MFQGPPPPQGCPCHSQSLPLEQKSLAIQMQLWQGPGPVWAMAGRMAQCQGEGLEGDLFPRVQHQGLWGDSWVLADPEPPLRMYTSRWGPGPSVWLWLPRSILARLSLLLLLSPIVAPSPLPPTAEDPAGLQLCLPGPQHPNALICDEEVSLSCEAVMTLVTGMCGVQVQLGFFPYGHRPPWSPPGM